MAYEMCVSEQMKKDISKLMRKFFIPGVAVGQLKGYQNSSILCFGNADIENGIPIDETTKFQVASISKSLTAWGILYLWQQGFLNLDTPVETYLKRWHLPSNSFNNQDVTVRRILSHTAGLSVEYYMGIRPGISTYSLEDSLSGRGCHFSETKVIHKPGSMYTYSGGGYTLLQLLVEEITGEEFNNFMQQNILNPLQMYNSTFFQDTSNAGCAKGYGYLRRKLANYRFVETASSGLRSTASDMLRFLMANMLNTKEKKANNALLNYETVRIMHSKISRNIPSGLGCLSITINNRRVVSMSGKNRGWNCRIDMLPEQGNGLFVLTNSVNGHLLYPFIVKAWYEEHLGQMSQTAVNLLRLQPISFIGSIMKNLYYVRHWRD